MWSHIMQRLLGCLSYKPVEYRSTGKIKTSPLVKLVSEIEASYTYASKRLHIVLSFYSVNGSIT